MLSVESLDFDNSRPIFIYNIDTFEMNSIRKYLLNVNVEAQREIYQLNGTLNNQENSVKVLHDIYPLQILNPRFDNFVDKVLSCDFLIFNTKCDNFEALCTDVRRVALGLEAWSKKQDTEQSSSSNIRMRKYVVLISTPLVWALTDPTIPDEEEETEDDGFVTEDNYRCRKAHKNYIKQKILERDVMWLQKKCKNLVRTIVVCPGVTYGAENDTFHYIFKYAFYNKQVPIIKPGTQNIPMIYIRDLTTIIKQFIEQFPESKYRYIFAVQPTQITLKTFIYNICKRFNGDCSKICFARDIEMLMFHKNLVSQADLDAMNLDIKMKPGYLKDFPYQAVNDKFWDHLVQEFREERNIRPLKIVIDGPPLVGKTEHAVKLAQHYQLIYLDIRQIVNSYVKYLEGKINDAILAVEAFECPEQIYYEDEGAEEGDEGGKKYKKPEEEEAAASPGYDDEDLYVIEDLKYRIDKWSKELFKIKVYLASHKSFDDQEFDFVSRCLIALLSTKQYNDNQGYILDCFPFTYEQASQIYYKTRRIDDFGVSTKEVTDIKDIPTLGEPLPPLRPTHVIILDASDELLCRRAMNFKESEAIMRRCLQHQMLPRIDAYRARNDEPDCLPHIFYDNDLVPINVFIEANTQLIDTMRSIKIDIGHPFVYPLSYEQKLEQDRKIEQKRREEREYEAQKKEQLLRNLTLDRERKIREWTEKFDKIRKQEDELREIKTLPMRQYLGKYILPTLTAGIVKVAEIQPDDPVDFLAEYLFKCNPEGQQAPPYCDVEQRERFYQSFKDDLSSL